MTGNLYELPDFDIIYRDTALPMAAKVLIGRPKLTEDNIKKPVRSAACPC